MRFYSFCTPLRDTIVTDHTIQPTGPTMKTQPTMTHPKPMIAAGLIACLVAAPSALAQNRVGSDGRALDANQQVGSAGVNPADGRLDFSQRNNIITGNVGGGRGFQDTIDYGSRTTSAATPSSTSAPAACPPAPATSTPPASGASGTRATSVSTAGSPIALPNPRRLD